MMTEKNQILSESRINDLSVSIVILTYNRPEPLKKLLSHLEKITDESVEIIVVDNNSDNFCPDIKDDYPFMKLVRMEENIGTAARNTGIEHASGSIVITLDDDVVGINKSDIRYLKKVFRDQKIGAVCFKIMDKATSQIMDWCHHRKKEEFHDKSFLTAEISEGAVAYRRKAFIDAGMYPEEFFISHEGPDLAFRLLNLGYKVIYDPNIIVYHSRSILARPSWRRYYYDTRNLLWLVVRNYPVLFGLKRLSTGIIAMGLYSLRDGFFRYWLKGIYHGIKGLPKALNNRINLSDETLELLAEIERYRPGIIYMIKLRLFKSKIKL